MLKKHGSWLARRSGSLMRWKPPRLRRRQISIERKPHLLLTQLGSPRCTVLSPRGTRRSWRRYWRLGRPYAHATARSVQCCTWLRSTAQLHH